MKKILFSIISVFIISISLFFGIFDTTQAAAVPLWNDTITWFDTKIWENTINIGPDQNAIKTINTAWQSILTTIKTIVSGLMVIYIVYAGIQMVISLWTEEEQLSSWKRQIWYTIIAFVFINIPWALFNAFNSNASITVDSRTSYSSWFKTPGNEWNIFIDAFSLGKTLNTDIIWFIEIIISSLAIIMIIIAGINMMTSRWNEEKITESKNKIIWSVIWLILVWFLEVWKFLVFSWEIEDWGNFFETATNLAFFFVWPIAIIYLTIAAYTYITSNWDEEKLKKAKSIVINVLLATIILLASYTFLLDLVTL